MRFHRQNHDLTRSILRSDLYRTNFSVVDLASSHVNVQAMAREYVRRWTRYHKAPEEGRQHGIVSVDNFSAKPFLRIKGQAFDDSQSARSCRYFWLSHTAVTNTWIIIRPPDLMLTPIKYGSSAQNEKGHTRAYEIMTAEDFLVDVLSKLAGISA